MDTQEQRIEKAICKNCGFSEDYELDEFGLTWAQADGTCPVCGEELTKENGEPTKETIFIKLVDDKNNL